MCRMTLYTHEIRHCCIQRYKRIGENRGRVHPRNTDFPNYCSSFCRSPRSLVEPGCWSNQAHKVSPKNIHFLAFCIVILHTWHQCFKCCAFNLLLCWKRDRAQTSNKFLFLEFFNSRPDSSPEKLPKKRRCESIFTNQSRSADKLPKAMESCTNPYFSTQVKPTLCLIASASFYWNICPNGF